MLRHPGQGNVFFFREKWQISSSSSESESFNQFVWCRCEKVFGLREKSSTFIRMCLRKAKPTRQSTEEALYVVIQVADAEKRNDININDRLNGVVEISEWYGYIEIYFLSIYTSYYEYRANHRRVF